MAFLYTQTTKGVYVYWASAAGKISPVNSSPYPVVGAMEDASGKYLISVGNTWLHGYPVESNGGLGSRRVPSIQRPTAAPNAEKPMELARR